MKKMTMIRLPRILLPILISVVLIAPWLGSYVTAQDQQPTVYEYKTTQVPTPTPVPSSEGKIALRYIADKYGIPDEKLAIVNEHIREYAALGKTYKAFSILELINYRFFDLLIDSNDLSVTEDIASIQRAEDGAHRDKYGKLEPALYKRIQEAPENEMIEVAILVAGKPRRNLEELFTELAAMFPEAEAALELSGKPFDVEDPEVRKEIEHAYHAMRKEDTGLLIRPVVEFLHSQGYVVTTYGSLSSITASLQKEVILSLTERPDVGQIFLNEGGGTLLLNSAVPTNRVPVVWQRGFEGTGRSIAVLETDNVDFTSNSQDCPAGTNNCFLHPDPNPRPGVFGIGDHATQVASAAASNHSTHRGVARDVQIYSVGMTWNTKSAFVEALEYSLDSNPGVSANVVNVSWGSTADQRDMEWIDWAVDDLAYEYFRMIVTGAGNQNICTTHWYLCSPSKAWNAISVGAYDNLNDANWSNDGMADFSSYVNPSGDREKPEVVAPGVEITAIKRNGVLEDNSALNSGTSFAAPQVAGLAALLIQRDTGLNVWPEASRAILLASSAHNIEGPSGIPTGQDLKDGAGGIDAALADEIAKTRWYSPTSPCTGPCWWGTNIEDIDPQTYLYRFFNATKGEKIRVAISWWSNADCADEANCNFDRLDTNLNLGVFDPSGNMVNGAWSASWDNNYELVEFTAPETGKYKIGVWKASEDQDFFDFLGIAWTRQATYLPDLKANSNGWSSTLVIRNDSPTDRDVNIDLFDANGEFEGGIYIAGMPPNSIHVHNLYPTFSPFIGSGVVDASEDISVVVINDNGSESYAYSGTPGNSSISGVGAETELFIPSYTTNYYGWSSTLYVQNTGAVATTIHAYLYNDNGSQVDHQNPTVNPGGQAEFSLSGTPNGSVRATAVQDLAAVIVHAASNMTLAYEGASSGGTVSYIPSLLKDYYGWTSSYQNQEVVGNSATVHVTYYPSGNKDFSLNARGHREVWMGAEPLGDLWHGSAIVTITGGSGKVATAVHHGSGAGALGYLAAKAGSKDLILPWIKNNSSGWNAALVVQNVGTVNTDVTVQFYNTSGGEVDDFGPFTLTPGESRELYGELPVAFEGSAWVHSVGADVIAVVHESHTNGRGLGYSAIP